MADISDLVTGSQTIIVILIAGICAKFLCNQISPSFSLWRRFIDTELRSGIVTETIKNPKGKIITESTTKSESNTVVHDILVFGFLIYAMVSILYLLFYNLNFESELDKQVFTLIFSISIFASGFFIGLANCIIKNFAKKKKQTAARSQAKTNNAKLVSLVAAGLIIVFIYVILFFIKPSIYFLITGVMLTQEDVFTSTYDLPFSVYVNCSGPDYNISILNKGESPLRYVGYKIGKGEIQYNVTIISPGANHTAPLDLTKGATDPCNSFREGMADSLENGKVGYIFTDEGTVLFVCRENQYHHTLQKLFIPCIRDLIVWSQ